jgi:hypothetical protein
LQSIQFKFELAGLSSRQLAGRFSKVEADCPPRLRFSPALMFICMALTFN